MMEYKGYHADVHYSDDDRLFVGEVFGINDMLGFHGSTVEELEKETVSEVVSRILFPEDASYVKVCDTSAYIKFTDEYMERYGRSSCRSRRRAFPTARRS